MKLYVAPIGYAHHICSNKPLFRHILEPLSLIMCLHMIGPQRILVPTLVERQTKRLAASSSAPKARIRFTFTHHQFVVPEISNALQLSAAAPQHEDTNGRLSTHVDFKRSEIEAILSKLVRKPHGLQEY